jgi:glycosyltransferase involved in cell wall biosynthesis
MASVSVIIITFNEENNIKRCLDSVKWTDEIIIVDSGSSDRTIEISKSYGAKVYHQDWLGFGLQKGKALSYVTGEWVLSLDADEVMTSGLKIEIQKIINSRPEIISYRIKRISQLYGSWIKHGDWKNDCPVRLIKSDQAVFSKNLVHESFGTIDNSKNGMCNNIILHYSFPNAEMMLNKINSYTTAAVLNKPKNSSLFKAILKGQWSFFRSYILKLGFLDGKAGLMLAIAAKDGTFYKYLKMYLECRKKGKIGL